MLTIAQLIDDYLLDARSRGASRAPWVSLKPIQAWFGQYTPDQITQDAIRMYTASRRHHLTGQLIQPSSLRRELVALRTVLNYGRKVGKVSLVPYIPLPDAGPPRDQALSSDQETRLLNLVWGFPLTQRMPRITRFVYLALCTGARRNAIETLRWEQVSFETGVIDYRGPGRVTKKRRVVVPISDRLRPVLERAYRERTSEWVLDSNAEIGGAWRKLVNGTEFEGFVIHDLRRTFATLLAQAGVDMWQIAGLLGDSLAVTVKHYAHHSPDYLRSAINAR